MLVDIDSKNNNEYIIEELDEEHILVKETKINELKARLNQVSIILQNTSSALTVTDDEGTLEGTGELRFGIDEVAPVYSTTRSSHFLLGGRLSSYVYC
jgi:hypothetical protein